MSCRPVHNTNLSLTSMLLESLGGRVISFSSVQMLSPNPPPPPPCLLRYINVHSSNGAGIFRQLNTAPVLSPANGANWQSALVMAGWPTVVQRGPNTHLLRRSLANCSPSMIGHYIIDSLFVQDCENSIWQPSRAVAWDRKLLCLLTL